MGELDARVEVLDFRLDSSKETGGRNARDDNIVPDFILPKSSCSRYGGSDVFLNGRTVRFEDREGSSIVFGDRFDVMVGSKLNSSNKRLLDCRVDSVSDGEVVGVVRESCAISLNDNSTVMFGHNRRDAFLFVGGIVVGAAGALAAFWALVRVGSGAISLDGGVVVVVGAGCLLCCCCS